MLVWKGKESNLTYQSFSHSESEYLMVMLLLCVVTEQKNSLVSNDFVLIQ